MFELRLLPDSEQPDYARWVQEHPDAAVFHSLPWIRFICAEHGGVPRIYRVLKNGALHGYWPFVMVRKGPFRLLGSPLRGFLTSRMGPLLRESLEPGLIDALNELCVRDRIAHLEVAGPQFQDAVMAASGYETRTRETYVLPILRTEKEQRSLLHTNCKRHIKTAARTNITVRQLDDTTYLKPLYDLVVQTYESKGLVVPFRYERIELLEQTIGRAGQFLFLGAFKDGEFVGGHIWAYDRKSAYALVSGSASHLRNAGINNLLLWEGIRRFSEWGLVEYDMYGGGKATPGVAAFKASFGSTYCSTSHYCRSFSRVFGALLGVYEHVYLRFRRYPAHY